VAEIDDKIVGHIAFSPITISDNTTDWYGLGPVSVKPDFQNKGIGKALINKGLSLLKERGAKGCTLFGDPNYYKHFGFKNYPELIYKGIPQEVFLFCHLLKKFPKDLSYFMKHF
jgi:putative acetyltransferase